MRPLTALMEAMLEDRAAGRPIDSRDAAPLGRQIANIFAEAAPGFGEAMSAREAEVAGALALEAYENDELRDLLIYSVQTGVAAIGAIPLLGPAVRAPKKAIEAAVVVISRAGEKAPKFADAAKGGYIPDGTTVTLKERDAGAPVELHFDGDAKLANLKVLDTALDQISRKDLQAEIDHFINGGRVSRTESTAKHLVNIDKSAGNEAANTAFQRLAQKFDVKPKELGHGRSMIVIPDVGQAGESMTALSYTSTKGNGNTINPRIPISKDMEILLRLRNSKGKIHLKVRSKERES